MSDLYLVLRRRLEDVTDWVELGTTTLRSARKQQGLSYEAMGRKLNVAAKTWERYEKGGRVPRHMLRRVAELLDLEIDWPARPAPITLDPERTATDPGLAAEAEDIRELRVLVDALLHERGLDPQQILRQAQLPARAPEPEDEDPPGHGEAAEAV